MGRKADRKQAPPRPLPGSDLHKPKAGRKDKGKKKAQTQSTQDRFAVKAAKGPNSKSREKRQRQLQKRKPVDQDDEDDSDLEDALKQGELSEDEDEEETVKVKSFKKGGDEEDLRTGPVKELVFSDSEGEDDLGDEEEQLPPGLHQFDLDEAPEGSDDDEEMDDEFDLEGEEDEEMMDDEDEVDSAFASSGDEAEGLEDFDMADGELDEEDEDGDIQTNLEDDLTNEGFTLPAVDGEEEEYEHGTSLRDVESRMRWLVGVCVGKEERTSKGVPGK